MNEVVNDTWVKGSQGWQIVAAQDYLAPK